MVSTKNEAYLLVCGFLSGYLGALFGVEFGLHLSSFPYLPAERKKALEESFTPRQKKVVDLLHVLAGELSVARFANVKKHALLLSVILKEQQRNCGDAFAGPKKHLTPEVIINRLFHQLGDFLLTKGFFHGALLFYQEALNDCPGDLFLMKKTAKAFYMLGRSYLPEAERLYRQILEHDRNDLQAYEDLGRVLELFRGRKKEAFQAYREALCRCRNEMERIFVYHRLLRLAPRHAYILFSLGKLYRLQGMFLEAGYYLGKVLQRRKSLRTDKKIFYLHDNGLNGTGCDSARGKKCRPIKIYLQANRGPGFWRKYEILELCGRGPSGWVWLGRKRAAGQKVAIKQIDNSLLLDAAAVRRIQGALKMMRTMSNPHLIPVYEDCYYEGRFFYAMEYMPGGNLAQYIKLRAPLNIIEAARIFLQICSALDYLYHKKGAIYHGALKPENILFSADGKLKIGDFDLIWALEGKRAFSADVLKKHNSFLNTFLYAAPERFNSKGLFTNRLMARSLSRSSNLEMILEGVDYRADLFSLGVIFFELLTGVLPFKKRGCKAAISSLKTQQTPSPRFFNPFLPPDLEKIIARLLHRNPDDRFASPAEASAALKKAKIF